MGQPGGGECGQYDAVVVAAHLGFGAPHVLDDEPVASRMGDVHHEPHRWRALLGDRLLDTLAQLIDVDLRTLHDAHCNQDRHRLPLSLVLHLGPTVTRESSPEQAATGATWITVNLST